MLFFSLKKIWTVAERCAIFLSMARPLLIAHRENAAIDRIWLTMKARWFNNHVCKNKEKLLERLDPAILDVIDRKRLHSITKY